MVMSETLLGVVEVVTVGVEGGPAGRICDCDISKRWAGIATRALPTLQGVLRCDCTNETLFDKVFSPSLQDTKANIVSTKLTTETGILKEAFSTFSSV